MARDLGGLLGVDLECRESGYKGGEYYRTPRGVKGKVAIQSNWTDGEGYLAEPNYPEYSVLIYVSRAEDHILDTVARLEDIILLKSEEI
ncbi:hypothetical protein ACWD3J_44565 [Streptomyces sp. NPDC002755]